MSGPVIASLLNLTTHEWAHCVAIRQHGFKCADPTYKLRTQADDTEPECWTGQVVLGEVEHAQLERDQSARAVVGLAGIVAEFVLADSTVTVEQILQQLITREAVLSPSDGYLAELIDRDRIHAALKFVKAHWPEILAGAQRDLLKLQKGQA